MSTAMLSPGANTALTANNPLLKDLLIGFGWNIIPTNGPMPELVASAIICDSNNKALSNEHFVFFNQITAPADNSVVYNEDEDEQIDVHLADIPAQVEKIVFIVYIDPELRKPGTFSAVRGAYIRVADRQNNDIARFNIPDSTNDINAMVFGELYRYKGEWKFRAVGEGFDGGIKDVCKVYGVTL